MQRSQLFTFSLIAIASLATIVAFSFTNDYSNVAQFTNPTSDEAFEELDNTILNEVTKEDGKLGGEGGNISGWVKITVIDEDGNIKQVHEDHNLIHTVGLGATSDHLFGTTHVTGEGTFDWIGLGTSNAALNASHTDCQAPTGSRLQDASVTNSGSNGAVINQSWVAVLGAVTLEEICLFDATSSGNMYARQLTGSIVVGASDTVNAEWTITFADSNAS